LGIDYHALRFLQHAFRKQRFGAVATIGRQGLHVPPWRVQRAMGLAEMVDFGDYCEPLLLEHFGAESVDSYDNSDYEAATCIWDMNQPIVPTRQYDTIIDAGTLEHVYNVPQALSNVSALARPGAQIIHVLPANGFCGHGFWQFSPELFFSLYSEANGYDDTEVFLAHVSDETCWYQVRKPDRGKRVDVVTSKALHVLVRSRLRGPFSHASVQQSDYAHEWAEASADDRGRNSDAGAYEIAKQSLRKMPLLYWAGQLAQRRLLSLFRPTALSPLNRGLTRLAIRDAEPSLDRRGRG
jgi:hypothetical protein